MRDIPHFDDGRALAVASGRFSDVFDPSTGRAAGGNADQSFVIPAMD